MKKLNVKIEFKNPNAKENERTTVHFLTKITSIF